MSDIEALGYQPVPWNPEAGYPAKLPKHHYPLPGAGICLKHIYQNYIIVSICLNPFIHYQARALQWALLWFWMRS